MTGSGSEKYHRYVSSGEISLLDKGGLAQFTVRFRTKPDADWQWANQLHSISDGELLIVDNSIHDSHDQPELLSQAYTDGISKYIELITSEVDVESRASQVPGSALWHISGAIDAAEEKHSAVRTLTLGVPSSMVRYFSLARVWTPWLVPRHGSKTFRLTEDAILCSFLREDGTNFVLLAVSGTNNILTLLKSGENGELVIKAQSDNEEISRFEVLASASDDFEKALGALIYEARKLVSSYAEGSVIKDPTPPKSPPGHDYVMVEKGPEVQWLTDWYDGLTYCTWNGLGQDLTEENILHALDALKANGINISNLIIDDNWQSLDNEGDHQFTRRWKHFEANPKAFPRGLKHAVDAIRQSHPNIEHIAVWHALFGYWGGISPESDLTRRYKIKEVKITNPAAGGQIGRAFDRGSLLAIDPDDVNRFYENFYRFLTSVGIDSVKTDAQFFLDLLENPEDRRRFITAYQDAWSIASLRYFSTRSISCMSQFPQGIFHSQLPTNKPTIPMRNSDDFCPDVADSHPWHVFCNAHNSLLTRFLNVIPDWDMFQTNHPYASFHAAARCISGGPIYITDKPGKHDMAVLDQMTAPTTHGATVILRPSVVGRTIDVYHDYNQRHILRVGTYNGRATTGTGILGLFNIRASEASCIVPLKDIPGIDQGPDVRHVVRAHSSGRITDPLKPSGQNSLMTVVLEEKGWEILTAYPTQPFTLPKSRGRNSSEGSPTHVAILGLLGKMTGAVALVDSNIVVTEKGRLRFDISLKALGTLGIYFSDLQDWSIEQNFMIMISKRGVPRKTVWKEGGDDSRVLAIDVLAAWKAMGLDSGWSNEVSLQVYVG
ncbi:hypothetical protein MW887_010647 [Aspergillus wentii]|nr:hypothetical protein MW887_010647 [Aspergillus wentii]